MAGMSDELKNFMSDLFAAQEVTRKQEHKDFKEDIQDMIKAGIKTEVEAATKPLKDSQDMLVKDQANLVKKVEDITKKVEILERKREFPVLEQSQVPMHLDARNHVTNNGSEIVTLNKDEKLLGSCSSSLT